MVQSIVNFGKRDAHFQKWICLDLDGTLVLKDPSEGSMKGTCHAETVQTLKNASRRGWNIAIITGRTLSFAKKALSSFDFPYTLAVQQGSHLFTMPQEKVLIEHRMDPSLVQQILTIFVDKEVPVIAYLGYKAGDACLYSREHVDSTLYAFYQKIEKISPKPWIELKSLKEASSYPSTLIKGFSHSAAKLKEVEIALQKYFAVSTTLIKDPLSLGQFYLLVTAKEATKGSIVKELLSSRTEAPLVIGAGDDENDLSMLSLCTHRLVMDDAPDSLKKIATMIVSSKDPLDLSSKIHDLVQ